jgi:hypothetical protein
MTHLNADDWKQRALYEEYLRRRIEHRLVTLHPELRMETAHACGKDCERDN